ncbi:MAG: hypothetical protein HQL72_05030 [Magnetococcales bacterium]|nr:hypothetical protein [Magnetococcales bacterium]
MSKKENPPTPTKPNTSTEVGAGGLDSRVEEPQSRQMARRRRLLKGLAAGVPAIVTLQSGAALAAASSNGACILAPSNKQTITETATGTRCAAGTDAFTSAGNWAYQKESAFAGGSADALDNNADGDSYCLIYVDSTGTLAPQNTPAANRWGADGSATGTPNTSYYAITSSCWASF